MLLEAGIFTESKVDICVNVTHTRKTAYLLQVRAAPMDILLEEADEDYSEEVEIKLWYSQKA